VRPRAEACERLAAATLRAVVAPGTERHTLPDGTALALQWRPVRFCFGGGPGVELLARCPSCGAWCRVLRRPPGQGWSCWRCQPVSHPSHRRSGHRRGHPKPASWRLDQIRTQQQRAARALGLEAWPPPGLSICWSLPDLAKIPPRPGAPRVSFRRRLALLQRLSALATLALAEVAPSIAGDLEALTGDRLALPGLQGMAQRAAETVAATAWAVRRPAGDQRLISKRDQSANVSTGPKTGAGVLGAA
jgi:hypothetical protein